MLSFRFRPVIFATLAGLTLSAQVDPKLQTSATDVLDIYGGTKNATKPEIITLIDRSGSTAGLSWDARYYTNTKVNWHLPAGNSPSFTNLFNYYDDSYNDDNDRGTLRVVSSNLYTNINFTVNLRCYNAGGSGRGTYTILTEGLLIKPNGNPVVSSDVASPTDKNLWVQQASHVRFAVTSKADDASTTYTYGGVNYRIPSSNCKILARPLSSSGNYTDNAPADIATSTKTRVIDIPLPWAVFDRVPNEETGGNHADHTGALKTMSPAPTGVGTAISNKHPQHMYLFDPVWNLATDPPSIGSSAQWYEIETRWWESLGNWGMNGQLLDSDGDFNSFDLTTDYLSWAFFGQDLRNQSETGAFMAGMVDRYKGDNDGEYTVADVREGGAGFLNHTRDGVAWTGNGLPQMTRFQAIKYAIIRTWIEQQDKVWWAIRFLNYCASGGGFMENGRSSATNCFSSSNLAGNPGDRMLLRLSKPSSANNPVVDLQYIQRMDSTGSTPLTFGLLNTYGQMASPATGNNGSVFNENKTENPIPSCRKSFVVVLSDGNPNDNNNEVRAYDERYDRWVTGTGSVTVNEWNGSRYVSVTYDACSGANGKALGTSDPWSGGGSNVFATVATPAGSAFAPTGANFNIWSLAALAAHLDPTKTGAPTDADNGGVTIPFRVTSRPASTTRRISTMTIGVSMAGKLTDADGAKAAMYRTALYGWENRKGFSASPLPLPYDENIAGRNDKDKNPYFFDAQSPEGIAQALKSAFDAARSVTNTMSAPVAPMLGLGVGNQMYFGTFTSGTTGQSVWQGDLLMTGLRVIGNTTTLLGKNGTDVLDTVSADNAVWSASAALRDKGWKNRTLYTLTPEQKSSTDPTPTGKFLKTLLLFNESTSKTALPNSMLSLGTDDADRRSLIRFMMGGSKEAQEDPAAITSIAESRDDMMGAIINSTPAILNFPASMAPASLSTRLANAYPSTTIGAKRFRLIMVGDNQGILHGFGELSGLSSSGVMCAAVEELWGFIPPDILSGLQTWRTGPKFRYLMDGSPTVYVQEKGTANGVIDSDGTNKDIVRVMVGLRKGGRSYYTFTFTDLDPSKPEIAWMIRPDESTDAVISKLGFATSTPAAARIQVSDTIRDVFFIGGGLSTKEVDTAFGTKLGRSILAIRAVEDADGKPVILKSWDFSADVVDKGCIPASVVPTEVILKSNKAQRLYFGTAFGQVYVLGNKVSSGLRSDTADIEKWELRTIFKSSYAGQSMGSAPTVFNVPYGYPVERSTTPTAPVPAVGVAFGLGDRNDPMDFDERAAAGAASGNPKPEHRMIMILDRQDSADISLTGGSPDAIGYNESHLADLTAITSSTDAAITASNTTSYYLRTKSGYRLEYPERTLKPGTTNQYYYQKTVTTPLVLNKAMIFTKFAPNEKADQCSGAGGTSYVYRMCDVLHPVFNSGSVNASSTLCSGIAAKFNDIPSEPGGVGLSSVMVVGEYQPPTGTGGTGTVDPTSIATNPITALTRPRAWRIVR